MEGPKVTIKLSCFDCDFCTGESYYCQGDSGTDVYCIHPSAVDAVATQRRQVGDSNWTTPGWCPLRKSAIDKMLEQL